MPETKKKPEKLTKQKKLKGQKEKPKGTIITVAPHGGTIHPSLSSSSASTVPRLGDHSILDDNNSLNPVFVI